MSKQSRWYNHVYTVVAMQAFGSLSMKTLEVMEELPQEHLDGLLGALKGLKEIAEAKRELPEFQLYRKDMDKLIETLAQAEKA